MIKPNTNYETLLKYCGEEPDKNNPTGFLCEDKNNKNVYRTKTKKIGNLVTTCEYNRAHNLIHTIQYTEDDSGNKMKPFEIWYDYDDKSRCIHSKNSRNYEEWYTYDESGRLIEKTTSEGTTTAYPIIDGKPTECRKYDYVTILTKN